MAKAVQYPLIYRLNGKDRLPFNVIVSGSQLCDIFAAVECAGRVAQRHARSFFS